MSDETESIESYWLAKPIETISDKETAVGYNAKHLQLADSRVLFDPCQALVHRVVECRQCWVVDSVRVLVREQLEGTKTNVWCIENVLAVHALGTIESRTRTLINIVIGLPFVYRSCKESCQPKIKLW